MPITKMFNKLLIFMKLYQHAQNKAISSIFYGDIADIKMLPFDWLRTFSPISQETDFPQIWDLCRDTENNIHFHYIT